MRQTRGSANGGRRCSMEAMTEREERGIRLVPWEDEEEPNF